MKLRIINIFFIILLLSGCVGTASQGVFGTGVSVALDPRSLGTQIDDSIMQKNLAARLTLRNKNYLLSINNDSNSIFSTAAFLLGAPLDTLEAAV